MNKIDLWEDKDLQENLDETSLYLIKAGTNNYGRQMFLVGYDDKKDMWDISAVPIPMKKSKCKHLIKLAEKELSQEAVFKLRRYKKDIKFEIIEYVNS